MQQTKESQSQKEKRLILETLQKLLDAIKGANSLSDLKKEFTIKGIKAIVNPFDTFTLSIEIADDFNNLISENVEDLIILVKAKYSYSIPKQAARPLPITKPKKAQISDKVIYKNIPKPNKNNARQKALSFGSLEICEKVYQNSLENIKTAKNNGMSAEYIESLTSYADYYKYVLDLARWIDFDVEKNDFLQNIGYFTKVLDIDFTRREILDLCQKYGLSCDCIENAQNACFTHAIDTQFGSIDSAIEYFETRLYFEKKSILRYCYKNDTVKSFKIRVLSGSEMNMARIINRNILHYAEIIREIDNFQYLG